jgi:hypothetical protein
LKTKLFEFILLYRRKKKDAMINMNRHGLFTIVALLSMLVLPQVVTAGWQVSSPEAAVPREPFFQAGTQRQTALSPDSYRRDSYPSEYSNLGRAASVYAVSVSGSIKDNIERIMKRYNWRVVWKAPYDYNFDGKVTGSSLPNVIQKLLQPFPLQAVMYMSNRTVAIVPRQIR